MAGIHGGILAGGAGARLGLGPKALVPLGGMTLLERAIATLRDACDTIAVSVSPARPIPGSLLRGVEVAADPAGAEGPLAGLVAALAGRSWERAVVLGVDFPLARPVALRELLRLLEGHAAVLPAPGGRIQPLLAAYSPGALRHLEAAFAGGERSVVAALGALATRVLDDAALARLPGGLENWLNVNTLAELAEAARRLEARAEGARA